MSFSSPSQRAGLVAPEPARTWQEHVRAGRLNEALASVLATAPDDSDAVYLLNELLSLREYLRAKAWGRAERLAKTLEPDLAAVTPTLTTEVGLLRESVENLERGRVDEALELLAQIELPMLLAEAETQRGTAYVFLGDTAEAERAFGRAIDYDPKHYRAITNRGNVALEAGRVDDAIALYQTALTINEQFANAHHNLGVAYRRKGQVHKSVQAIRKAQRVGRGRDRDEAKESMRGLVTGRGGRYARWLIGAVGAVALYFVLQALNII